MKRKVNFFMVGAPKCGTTAMADFLSQHPNIFFSTPKEVGYFCKDLIKKSDEFHGKKKNFPIRTQESFNNIFTEWKDEKIAGEGSTLYIYSKEAPEHIHTYNPEAKILIIIREPSDFLFSLYHQFRMSGIELDKSFEESLLAEKARREGKETIPQNITFPEHIFYDEMVRFSTYIKRYIKVFGKKQVKVLLYDEFRKDNDASYQEVISFLGLEEFHPQFEEVNVRHKIKHRWLLRIAQHPSVWALPKKLLPKQSYYSLKKALYARTKKPSSRTKIKSSTEKMLKETYHDEVKTIGKLIGRDLLTHWKYP